MTQNLTTGVPAVPNTPMVDAKGTPTLDWYTFFVNLWTRTGGNTANPSTILDQISSTVGSIFYRSVSSWTGLSAGATNTVLKIVGGFPSWGFLDGTSFGSQTHATFFAAPTTVAGDPSFRVFATADFASVAGAFPGTPGSSLGAAGNVGEIISVLTPRGAAISLTNAAPANIAAITLSAGDWDVWATLAVTPTAATSIAGWISLASATDPGAPNDGAYVLSNPPAALTSAQVLPVGMMTLQISGTTSVYFCALVSFTGTATAYGVMNARRRR